MDKQHKQFYSWIVLFVFLAVCIFQYAKSRLLGPILFPDEFGYWAAAAKFAGYNWSEVTSISYYYSYGYSLLLLPILSGMENMTLAYRIAIAMNIIFLLFSYFVLFQIVTALSPQTGRFRKALLCGAGIFYSGHIFYMQLTLPETLLVLLLFIQIWVLESYLRAPQPFKGLLLSAVSVYMYYVHMRSIAMLVSMIVILMLSAGCSRHYRKGLLAAAVGILLFLTGGYIIKAYLQNSLYLYASEQSIAVNDYAGQIEKIVSLCTLQGIQKLFISMAGKIYYLGAATGGLFFGAIKYLVRGSRLLSRQRYLYLFVSLSIVLHLTVVSIFTMTQERIDIVLYGRYNDIFIPLFICLGVLELLQTKVIGRYLVSSISFLGSLAVFLGIMLDREKIQGIYGYFVIGLNDAVSHPESMEAVPFMIRTFILGMIGQLMVLGIAKIIRSNGRYEWLLSAFLAGGIGMGLICSERYIYFYQHSHKSDLALIEAVKETEKPVSFLFSEGTDYIDLFQFLLKEQQIQVLSQAAALDEVPKETMIVIYQDNERKLELSRHYELFGESECFIIYY